MKIALVRDGISYELGVTCTFQLCITGQVSQALNSEADIAEELLAKLDQTGFFKHTATTLKTSIYQEKRRNHHDADDESAALFDDDVPF